MLIETYSDTAIQTEVEGTVEPGILVVSWSPDDSLLALATGIDRFVERFLTRLTCIQAKED